MQTQITHSPSRWDSPLKTQVTEYPRDRTCPRQTHRYGMSIREFSTVCPSVGWLNTRLTYGCVESRLTRACETSTLVPFPPFSAVLLPSDSVRYYIYQNNPVNLRMSRFTERSIYRAKRIDETFQGHVKICVSQKYTLRIGSTKFDEFTVLYNMNLTRLQKNRLLNKKWVKCLRMKTWTRSEICF